MKDTEMKALQKKTILLPALLAAVSGGVVAADNASAAQTSTIEKSVIKQSAIALTAAEMAAVVAGSYTTGNGVYTALFNNGLGNGTPNGISKNWGRGNCVGLGTITASGSNLCGNNYEY
jgi:hypothetical protein